MIVIVFISSFFYMEKERHQIYYYSINVGGTEAGTVRIDTYHTEDKKIYKSVSHTPFFELITQTRQRLVLGKSYTFESYTEDAFADNVPLLSYLERRGQSVGFVSRTQSRFGFLDSIPVKDNVFLFIGNSPLAYLPLIENYDFRRGRSQAFNAISLPEPLLPPMKRLVVLTSIKDEYLIIDGKNLKSENLILKIRNHPQAAIWVSKSDHSLLRLEIPSLGLRIVRRFKQPAVSKTSERPLTQKGYEARSIAFKSKNIELGGTLTLPAKEGRLPAVILIWGSGPQNRNYQGVFVSIADFLSKKGYCVLSYDKRGIGSSKGNAITYGFTDISDDISAAFEYLAQRKEVDPGNIHIVSHGEGALPVSMTCSLKKPRSIIMLAPRILFNGESGLLQELKDKATEKRWSDDYLTLAVASLEKTCAKIMAISGNWAFVLRKRVYLGSMREELKIHAVKVLENIRCPVLIMQGKEDSPTALKSAVLIDKILSECKHVEHYLTYYGYLGRFLGKLINNGKERFFYEVDSEALEGIRDWLAKHSQPGDAVPEIAVTGNEERAV